jgi:hypothetical protein
LGVGGVVYPQRTNERRQNLLVQTARQLPDYSRQLRVSQQSLMPALVSHDRLETEIGMIAVTLKRFRVDDQQIATWRGADTKLRATALAINVSILDIADESQRPRDASNTL